MQREWAEYKAASLLPALHVSGTVAKNGGWGDYVYRGRSGTRQELTDLRKELYIDGKKRVTLGVLNKLNNEGIAWWFCDDGAMQASSASLHTEGFEDEDQEIIQAWFNAKGMDCAIQCNSTKGLQFIRFRAEGARVLIAAIKPHIPACMAYKIREGIKCR